MSIQMCKWCDNEIVWDPEIGPEEFCPHCFNELDKNYRTVNVSYDGDMDDAADDFSYGDYEDKMDGIRALQTSSPECTTCGELMVEAGEEYVQSGFRPLATIAGEPLLKPPFTLLTYVCPACFEVKRALSEADREKWKVRASLKDEE